MDIVQLEFDKIGHLIPYGLIPTNLETAEAIFVNAFTASETQRRIWQDLLDYLTELRAQLGTNFESWLDGGFTTRKVNPSDVDFVVFVETEIYQRHLQIIDEFRVRRTKCGVCMDGYFVEVFPEAHPNHFYTRSEQAYWLDWFSRNRRKKPKGFLKLIF
jgi:hypothetical protein